MSASKDPEIRLPEHAPSVRDPFPNLTFARKYLWNFLDQNAYRRMLRLGVPSPWHAYDMGYRAARAEFDLERAQEKINDYNLNLPPPPPRSC